MAVSQSFCTAVDSVTVHRAAESEALISLTLSFSLSEETLSRSSVLEQLVDALSIGGSESITAPRGYVESWARFAHGQLRCSGADDASLLTLVKGADFFADCDAVSAVCHELGGRLSSQLALEAPGSKKRRLVINGCKGWSLVEQVLQLPAHLAAAVFKESGVQLDTCLECLPPGLHGAVLSTIIPEVATQGVLRLDSSCAAWSNKGMVSSAVLCALLNAVTRCSQLSEMHLDLLMASGSGTVLSTTFISALASLTNLTALSVGGAFRESSVLSAIAPVITSLPRLEQFKVLAGRVPRRGCPGDFAVSPELADSLGECSSLCVLHISSFQCCAIMAPREDLPLERKLLGSIVRLTRLECLELTAALASNHCFQLTDILPSSEQEQLCMPHLLQLTITNCSIGPSGPQFLSVWLKHMPSLQHLTLARVGIRSCDALPLAESFKRLTVLRSLNLSDSNLEFLPTSGGECDHFKSLLQSCADITTLEDFNFSGSQHTSEGFEATSHSVSSWHNLTALKLGPSSLYLFADLGGSEVLVQSLSMHTSLQHLDLRNLVFSRPAVSTLLPCLAQHHKGLCHLNLGFVDKRAEGQILASGLSDLTNLTFLALPRPTLSPTKTAVLPAVEVATALPKLRWLQELDLSACCLGGSVEVVRCLSALTCLTQLCLYQAGITSSTATVLADSLRNLQMLQSLDMSDNMLTGSGQCLASALGSLRRLRNVCMRYAELERGEAVLFIEAMKYLSALSELDITGNVSSDEYWEEEYSVRYWDWEEEYGGESTVEREPAQIFCKSWVKLPEPQDEDLEEF